MEKRLKTTWQAAAYDKQKQEWVHTELNSYDHNPDDIDWQATPARITASRRKEKAKNYLSIVAMGDAQIGYRRVLDHEMQQEEMIALHDERKMATARAIARYCMPDIIVNLGDNIDLPDFSKFAPDSDHFYRTLAPSLQGVHDYYAQLRADNPNARIVEVSSNHNERFNKAILRQMPQLYNVKRPGDDSKYPVASYAYMANLEHVGVEFIDGYPAGELVIPRIGKAALRFAHGTETSSPSSSAASKAMKNNPYTFNFQGHSHTESSAWHTLPNGEQVGTFVLGALCRSTGIVPSYHNSVSAGGEVMHHQENWHSSIGHIRMYEDGELEVNTIAINKDAVAHYEGKEFGCE